MQTSRRAFLRLGILGSLGLLGGWGYVGSRQTQLSKIPIWFPDLPIEWDGLKIAQITDIHAGPLVPPELIRQGVELIQSERPDLIVLTGDFVHGETKFLWTTVGGFKSEHFEDCLRELSVLSAPLGVWAVLGNHDHWSGPEVLKSIIGNLASLGVRTLRNETVNFQRNGQHLSLIGVDDYWEGPADLSQAMKGIPQKSYRILLSHNPDINEDVEAQGLGINLIISGHTHGGQISLPFIGPPYPTPFNRRYLSGLVRDGQRQTWISRGLGVFLLPVRLGCPSDVSVLTLRRGSVVT